LSSTLPDIEETLALLIQTKNYATGYKKRFHEKLQAIQRQDMRNIQAADESFESIGLGYSLDPICSSAGLKDLGNLAMLSVVREPRKRKALPSNA
jgi:hypothetical protein